jgi:hypothetical protein
VDLKEALVEILHQTYVHNKSIDLLHRFDRDKHNLIGETVGNLINIVKEVGAEDPNVMLKLSYVICEYFQHVLHSYPLQLKGLSPLCQRVFAEYNRIPLSRKTESVKIVQYLSTSKISMFLSPSVIIPTVIAPLSPDTSPRGDEGPEDIIHLFTKDDDFVAFLESLVLTKPVSLYRRILAHEGLNECKWRSIIKDISNEALKLQKLCADATIVIFVDEMNTAGALGMISEVMSNHSLDGALLPTNIFFAGAINPQKVAATKINDVMNYQTSLLKKNHENEAPVGASVWNRVEKDEHDYLANVPFIVRDLPMSLSPHTIMHESMSLYEENAFTAAYISANVGKILPRSGSGFPSPVTTHVQIYIYIYIYRKYYTMHIR